MFVLIGEFEGDYDDFYQRYREAVAVSSSKEILEHYRDRLITRTAPRSEDNEHSYVEFDIEEVLHIERGNVDEWGGKIEEPSGEGEGSVGTEGCEGDSV